MGFSGGGGSQLMGSQFLKISSRLFDVTTFKTNHFVMKSYQGVQKCDTLWKLSDFHNKSQHLLTGN